MNFTWFIREEIVFFCGLIFGFILVKLFWYYLARWRQKRARREQKRIQFLRCKKLIREKMVVMVSHDDGIKRLKTAGLLSDPRHNDVMADAIAQAVQSWREL